MPYGAQPAEPTTDTPAPSGPAYGEGQVGCRYCGSVPAVEATFRGHQGIVVIMRYLKRQGPFCRSCGIAAHRDMTSDSLWQGWWGIASMIVNPIVMLINIPQRLKVNKLTEPLPGAPRAPMNTGKPVYLRPTILGALIPVVLISLIVLAEQSDPEFAKVGDCVRNNNAIVLPGVDDHNADVKVLSCSDPNAQFKVIGREEDTNDGDAACRKYPDVDGFFSYKRDSDKYTLCLQSLKPKAGSGLSPS